MAWTGTNLPYLHLSQKILVKYRLTYTLSPTFIEQLVLQKQWEGQTRLLHKSD